MNAGACPKWAAEEIKALARSPIAKGDSVLEALVVELVGKLARLREEEEQR